MGERLAILAGGATAAGVFLLAGNRVLAFVIFAVAIILSSLTGGTGLDPVRLFSDEDRSTIYARAGGRCQNPLCGAPVHYEGDCPLGGCDFDFQADHVHPWSKGGRTVLSNGACLCRRCNQEKSNH